MSQNPSDASVVCALRCLLVLTPRTAASAQTEICACSFLNATIQSRGAVDYQTSTSVRLYLWRPQHCFSQSAGKKKRIQVFCADATSVKWGNSKGFAWMNRAVTASQVRSKLSIAQWMFDASYHDSAYTLCSFWIPTKVLSEQKTTDLHLFA